MGAFMESNKSIFYEMKNLKKGEITAICLLNIRGNISGSYGREPQINFGHVINMQVYYWLSFWDYVDTTYKKRIEGITKE